MERSSSIPKVFQNPSFSLRPNQLVDPFSR
jgi:hypothetical protein